MGARGAAVLALVLAAGALAACGATPAEAGAGNSDPPGTRADTSGTPTTALGGGPNSTSLSHSLTGIDPAQLPSTAQAVANVLAKLPAAVNGHPMTERTGKRVGYADGTTVEAQPLAEAAGEGMTMAQFWPRLAAGHPGDFKVTGRSKPGEPALWLTADGEGPYGAYVAVVASRTGTWIFGVDSPSENAANELLTVFRAALD